jgi:hypothetical protein
MRLAGETPDGFPVQTVKAKWSCFEDEFESYCRGVLGADFDTYRDAIAEEFGYDRPSDVLKNFDAVGEFITKTYKSGKRLPALEEMVAAITALSPVT